MARLEQITRLAQGIGADIKALTDNAVSFGGPANFQNLKLGAGPRIVNKKITANTGSGPAVSVAHGLDPLKILDFTILMDLDGGRHALPLQNFGEYYVAGAPGVQCGDPGVFCGVYMGTGVDVAASISGAYIVVDIRNPRDGALNNKPLSLFITYEA